MYCYRTRRGKRYEQGEDHTRKIGFQNCFPNCFFLAVVLSFRLFYIQKYAENVNQLRIRSERIMLKIEHFDHPLNYEATQR